MMLRVSRVNAPRHLNINNALQEDKLTFTRLSLGRRPSLYLLLLLWAIGRMAT